MRPASFSIIPAQAIIFATEVFSQSATPDTTSVSGQIAYSPSLFGIVVKLIISMVLIVGLIYLTMYLLKKINNRAAGGGVIGDTVRIIGRTFLSPKQALYLVRIGKKYAILGATENNVNMISELNDDEAQKIESREIGENSGSRGGKFAEIFKGLIRQ